MIGMSQFFAIRKACPEMEAYMPKYVAAYDYHKHRDYKKLYDLMEQLGGVRILESMWLVAVNATAPELRDALVSLGDGDESFVVLELVPDADWATVFVPRIANQWLSKNVAEGVSR
jgi:hypothetical protein